MELEHTEKEWSEDDWCNALEAVLVRLGDYFFRTEQQSMALLLFIERSYMRAVDQDLSALWKRYTFFRFGGRRDGLYRVIRYNRLFDTFFFSGGYGFSTLIGVPEDAIPRIRRATKEGSLTIWGSDDPFFLRGILEPHTPYYFGLAAYTEDCRFSATYSSDCPEGIRHILDETIQKLPLGYRYWPK